MIAEKTSNNILENKSEAFEMKQEKTKNEDGGNICLQFMFMFLIL